MTSVSAKISEPSMEDILASIRRIIADDQETLHIVQGCSDPSESSPLRNVLDLTEQQVAADIVPLPADFAQETALITDPDDLSAVEEAVIDFPSILRAEQAVTPSTPLDPDPASPMSRAKGASAEQPLLSEAANASIAGAFGRLDAATVQSSPKTLEDLAKEMLRPMLKTWLDDNLPPLVERLVQAEIERVTRGRR